MKQKSKVSFNIPGESKEEVKKKARALDKILKNCEPDNLEFLAELAEYQGVNWKLRMGKSQIRKNLK